ncbi:MAG: hypothetical protein MZV70_18410 [Desulfobacterales bacterium]|nr:hypothetical protein [Desulfobacterales bacterium]
MGHAVRPRPVALRCGRLHRHGIDLRRPGPRGPGPDRRPARRDHPRDGRGRRERRHPDLRHRAGPGPDVPPQPPRLRQGHPGPARVPRQPDGQGSDPGLRAPRRVLRRGGPAALRRGPEPRSASRADHRPHARGIQGHQRSPRGPAVIMAGSGMVTGGRIKHHLARNIGRPESTILFVGYQARETLGRQILEGARRSASSGRPCRSGPA